MKCSYCSTDIERGTGTMYVQVDGRIFYFCSSKCQKGQLKLHRKGWETRWTETFRAMKGRGGAKKGAPGEKKPGNKKQEKKQAKE